MFQISKAEAMYIRSKTDKVHIRMCGRQHPARDHTYYADESPLSYRLVAEYQKNIEVEHVEVDYEGE